MTFPFFDRPWLLPLALLLPAALVAAVIIGQRRRRLRLAKFGTDAMVRRLVPNRVYDTPVWRAVRLALAALFAALAIAGPRWGTDQTIVRASGVDVVLVLDASLSMLARDDRPNRLERMKVEVRRLRSLAGGDRIGLLAFAGRSYILTPLTIDDGALDLYLENFDPTIVGQPGTSLSRPISQALSLLQSTPSASDKAIVVMTDGEAHEPTEAIAAAAQQVKDAGIAFVIVGFGTEQGTTIPIRENGAETVKRDENGEIVVTRYRPEVLRAAADAAGGTFIDAGETDKAGRIRNALSSLRAAARGTSVGQVRRPRFQLFLLPAFLLLLLDTLLSDRRGGRRKGVRAAASEVAPPMTAAT